MACISCLTASLKFQLHHFWIDDAIVLFEHNVSVDNVYKLTYTLIKYKDVFGDDSMDISEKIKELRKKTGLSQSKFSAKFGIPVRTLQQWEQGISAPPEYLVRMMAYIMLLEEKFEDTNSK